MFVCYAVWYLVKNHISSALQNRATWDNPAANFLPYEDWTNDALAEQVPFHVMNTFLKEGIPLSSQDKLWNKHHGAREIHPVHHRPLSEKANNFFYDNVTSCKEDRTQCLPVPNIAISQKQNLTI